MWQLFFLKGKSHRDASPAVALFSSGTSIQTSLAMHFPGIILAAQKLQHLDSSANGMPFHHVSVTLSADSPNLTEPLCIFEIKQSKKRSTVKSLQPHFALS